MALESGRCRRMNRGFGGPGFDTRLGKQIEHDPPALGKARLAALLERLKPQVQDARGLHVSPSSWGDSRWPAHRSNRPPPSVSSMLADQVSGLSPGLAISTGMRPPGCGRAVALVMGQGMQHEPALRPLCIGQPPPSTKAVAGNGKSLAFVPALDVIATPLSGVICRSIRQSAPPR